MLGEIDGTRKKRVKRSGNHHRIRWGVGQRSQESYGDRSEEALDLSVQDYKLPSSPFLRFLFFSHPPNPCFFFSFFLTRHLQ